jgi:D-alanyl-D-alanine carboxypeptidase (penicillin-binding protein 5/6)
MKRLLVSFLAALSLTAQAQAPQPPEIAARNYVLVDLTTHKTLAEREADVAQDPASLTKLMTAYVVFGALRDKKLTLEQTLPVSKRAWDERKGEPSLMFIDTTMTPKVDELLRGLIIQSGNDAAVALAEGVGGSVENFVQLMNRQAQAWGLTRPAHATSPPSPPTSSRTSPSTTPTTRSATTPSTRSARTTATCCCAATRRWTA